MQVTSVESTELFTGPPEAPVQVVLVTLEGASDPVTVRVDGDGWRGSATGRGVVEVPVSVEHPVVGQRRAAQVHITGGAEFSTPFEFVVAEPGWTMFMISH